MTVNLLLVITFLKFLYDQDPVRHLLEISEEDYSVDIDSDTEERVQELVQFGGFSDTKYLQKTLAKEFEELEHSFKEAFQVPFTTISEKIHCEDVMPLLSLPSTPISRSLDIPSSISYYEDEFPCASIGQLSQHRLVDYICFRIPDECISDLRNSIGIVRGFIQDLSSIEKGYASMEAILLSIPEGYNCVDLSLYKESQIVLLLNEETATSENPGSGRMIIVQASTLPFVSLTRSTHTNHWKLHDLKDSAVDLCIENEKVRCISHSVLAPLAVSASRGVACVFAARKRALVYILEEDEDEVSDVE